MGKTLAITASTRFWNKVLKTDTCWLWTGTKDSRGYGRFAEMDRKMVLPHRFSWEIHFGRIAQGLQVCHKCDNPSCVNPKHLFLGTNSDNIQDSLRKGRFATGKRARNQWSAKQEIRNRVRGGK
jgi:hypothetical protein